MAQHESPLPPPLDEPTAALTGTPDPGRRATLARLAWVPPAVVVLTLTPRMAAASGPPDPTDVDF